MKIIPALLLFALPCLVFAAPPDGYSLKWSDEFDGTALDTNNWSFDTTWGMFADVNYKYYTNGLNLTLENGSAVLWAKKERFKGYDYTSCFINTRAKKEFMFGYMEAKIRTPHGRGLWPAFWMLGSNYNTAGWPVCGEIDLYEQRTGPQLYNGTPGDNCFNATCFFNGASGLPSYNAKQFNDTECLCNDYHLYAIEWDSLGIKYFFDGTLFWEYDTINASSNVATFHQPFYIIANIDIGNLAGPIDTTVFPQRMYIDYVRVYQKSTPAISSQQKHTIPDGALLYSSHANLNLYDLQGRFVGDFSNLFRLVKYDEGLFVNAVKSRVPQGVYLARISMGRHIVNERLVVKK
jgi:beta-glucanase (GH16 family)